MSLLIRICLCSALLLLGTFPASASVDPTSGEFKSEVTDIWVKVPGGQVAWIRRYEKNVWKFAPAWERLRIELDALEGTVARIRMGRDAFEKVDTAGTLYRYDQRQTIRKIDTGWRWQNRDGYWFEYDADGIPQRFGDRSNNAVHLEHDDNDRLIAVHDAIDRQVLTITWSGDQVSKVEDYSGRSVSYAYSDGLLTQVTDVRGYPWRYEYSNKRLVKLIDPLGNTTPLTLTASGRAGVVTGPDGAVTRHTFEYLSAQKLYYLKTVRENGELQEITETWTDRDRELVRKDINGITVLTVTKDGRKRIHSEPR